MRKGFFIFLTTIILITVVGCWNRRELDTLAIVMAVGIDKSNKDDKISVSFQIMKPNEIKAPSSGSKGSSGGSKGVWVMTSTGYTIFDAARNATIQSDRRLFFPQSKVIVIGEEMARTGIKPLLDFFDRDPEPRRLSWLLISKGKASEIINADHEQEKIPAKAIEGMVKASGATSMAVRVNLNDFFKNLSSPTADPVAGLIEMIDEEENGGSKKMRVTGAAVFKKDKLVGWLNRPETRGLNWILGKVQSGIIVVKSPKEENKDVALEIIRASSKITPEIRGSEVIITVEVKEEGNLAEQMSDIDLTSVEMFKILEERKAQVIKNEIHSVLNKAQKEWGVDIFGFGETVYRKYPKEWKDIKDRWRDEFPEIKVEVKINAKLRTGGLSTAPTKAKSK